MDYPWSVRFYGIVCPRPPNQWLFFTCAFIQCRSEDPALAQAQARLQSYQHQVSQPLPHQAPLSPVSHSKSIEFPRVNGHFDSTGGLPPGIPTTTQAGGSLLPRSSSSGLVWNEQKALDRDDHHFRSQESKYKYTYSTVYVRYVNKI